MARFWLLVTMITCSMPAATASSTAYWMTGLSTSGSISLGCALVAGRKRVPQPAAGKTALRMRIEPRRTWRFGRAASIPGGRRVRAVDRARDGLRMAAGSTAHAGRRARDLEQDGRCRGRAAPPATWIGPMVSARRTAARPTPTTGSKSARMPVLVPPIQRTPVRNSGGRKAGAGDAGEEQEPHTPGMDEWAGELARAPRPRRR